MNSRFFTKSLADLGPARTTITDIANRAGVGRPTVYRHFPDEMSLLHACSGFYWEQNPAPDPHAWDEVADPIERLTTAFLETYAYHRRTSKMITRVLADVGDTEVMEPYHEHWRRAADVVAAAWPSRTGERRRVRAAIGHALDFTTWMSLVRHQRLSQQDAITLMVHLVVAAGRHRGSDLASARPRPGALS